MNNKRGHAIAFIRGIGAGMIAGSVLLLIIVGVMMLISSKAEACDEVYLGALSYHVNDSRDLESAHYLLACERSGYIAGVVENSHGNPTAMLGKSFDLFSHGDIESRVYIGATYGYYGCDNREGETRRSICPMVVPEISYTKYRLQPAVVILGNAVALTLKVSI